jgi:hypothetical protein
MARSLVCGVNLDDLLARYDRARCYWKTLNQSFEEMDTKCLTILPRWGMTRAGALYRLPTPERRIFVSVGGVSPIPTPRTRGLIGGSGSKEIIQRAINGGMDMVEASILTGIVNWATPQSTDAKHTTLPPSRKNRQGRQISNDLAKMDLRQEGMKMNPEWFEALMGLPGGWTEID